ncbi:MAG: hypothetical protein IT430_17085 [Phycisphaerales bacterium]|nr:hypothetical protein [Phycisphaerales bacterium]
MKKKNLAVAALALVAAPAFGQTYDNGGMDPRSGGCSGGMYSAIEAPGTIYGNNTIVTSFHQADDFTVPSGQQWTPTELRWYLYQTNAGTNEPIVDVYIQLWRGSQADMIAGTATLVGGDMTTDRLISSTFTNIYRTTASDILSCARAIKECRIDMSWVGALSSGQYWIEVGSTGNPSFSGPWANHKVPRDIVNDNSIFFTVGGAWAANTDAGYGAGWDYPFKLDYTGGGGGFTAQITGTCPGTVRLAWNGAPANKPMGIVFARNTGSFTINSGQCAGTQLGLGTNQLQLYNTINTGNGSGAVNAQASSGACGGFVQLVAVDSPCKTSNVVQVP